MEIVISQDSSQELKNVLKKRAASLGNNPTKEVLKKELEYAESMLNKGVVSCC